MASRPFKKDTPPPTYTIWVKAPELKDLPSDTPIRLKNGTLTTLGTVVTEDTFEIFDGKSWVRANITSEPIQVKLQVNIILKDCHEHGLKEAVEGAISRWWKEQEQHDIYRIDVKTF